MFTKTSDSVDIADFDRNDLVVYAPASYPQNKRIAVVQSLDGKIINVRDLNWLHSSEVHSEHLESVVAEKIDAEEAIRQFTDLIEQKKPITESGDLYAAVYSRLIYNYLKIIDILRSSSPGEILLEKEINPPETGVYVASGNYQHVLYDRALIGVIATPRLTEFQLKEVLESQFMDGCALIPDKIYHPDVDQKWGTAGAKFPRQVRDCLVYQVGSAVLEGFSVTEIPESGIDMVKNSSSPLEATYGVLNVTNSKVMEQTGK